MADPLLTSLCSICHVSKPKYKCPRCQMQTCSATCIQKHKAWSECSGERDATAFVPRSQLRTVSGIDHDYNFLHKMDLSMERAERVLISDKGLVRKEELLRQAEPQARWKTGSDGRRKKVPAPMPKADRQTSERPLNRQLAHKLRRLNVRITQAPEGMMRQRENKTTFNRRLGIMNWQVEWLTWSHDHGEQKTAMGRDRMPTTRLLSKVPEDMPIYQAYQAACDEAAQAGRPRAQRSGRREEAQRPSDSTWNAASSLAQDPVTGRWVCHQGSSVGESWPREVEETQRRRFQFFLGGPPKGSHVATVVTPVKATGCLRDILSDTEVVEYPTLYVLESGESVPAAVAVEPQKFYTEPQESFFEEVGTKRRGAPLATAEDSVKRRRQDGDKRGWEEGEIDGDGEGDDDLDAVTVAEESEDDDSSTSSSGTDGESDGRVYRHTLPPSQREPLSSRLESKVESTMN